MRERRLVFSNYLGSDHELIYRTSRTLNLGGLGPNIFHDEKGDISHESRKLFWQGLYGGQTAVQTDPPLYHTAVQVAWTILYYDGLVPCRSRRTGVCTVLRLYY